MDTLITIAVVALFFISSYAKAKKKKAQQEQRRQQQMRRRPAPAPVTPSFEEETKPLWQESYESVQTAMEEESSFSSSSYEETPKNQPYFTYETIEPEIQENYKEENASSHNDVEKVVQNIGNEEEKMRQISFEKEELIKGIIYSEILKRPYN